MSLRLNPFKDVTSDPRAEFRRQMAVNPEQCGNPESSAKVKYSGSELSHKDYNAVFEGDSWSFDGEKTTLFQVSLRPMTFASSGDENSKLEAKADTNFLSLGEKRSHAHFVLGKGDDAAEFQGNSQRNIAVIESDAGDKSVRLDLGGGDDKAVLFLKADASGVIFVDGGDGQDSLEIHSRNPEQKYQIIRDPKELELSSDGKTLRIVTSSVEDIKEFPSQA